MAFIAPPSEYHEVLPHDIFEHVILPDLLSEHLHALLLDPVPSTWHAFYVLPLVSKSFNKTCQSLFSKMFGTKRRTYGSESAYDSEDQGVQDPDSDDGFDGFDDPDDYDPSFILNYAIKACERARRPASKSTPLHAHNLSTLLGDKSLIRVYTCLALGMTFLNADVLLPLGLTIGEQTNCIIPLKVVVSRGRRTGWNDYEDSEASYEQVTPSAMEEENMHRCFMRFECALRICDEIAPMRLAYVVAGHMARVLPLYITLPSLAKTTSDLRLSVAQNYKSGQGYYTDWAVGALRRLEDQDEVLGSMMAYGNLVSSFWDQSGIPIEALKLTRIVDALDDVVKADWGEDTAATRGEASALIRRWIA